MAGFTSGDIDKLFTYRRWSPQEVEKFGKLRLQAKELAHAIQQQVPVSPEQTLAIRALHECVYYFNTAVTLYPQEE